MRSPFCTPAARRPCVTRDTLATRSALETRRLTLSSPQNTSASPASSGKRPLSRFSAKLSRASGNQRAPGILSASTSVRRPGSPTIPASLHTSRQNASGSSVDHRNSAEKSASATWCFAVTRAANAVRLA